MIELLGTGGTIPIPDPTIVAFANGTLTPTVGWIVTAIVLAIFAVTPFLKDGRRRASGLVAPPMGLTILRLRWPWWRVSCFC